MGGHLGSEGKTKKVRKRGIRTRNRKGKISLLNKLMFSYTIKYGGTVFTLLIEPLLNTQSWTKAGVKNPSALPEAERSSRGDERKDHRLGLAGGRSHRSSEPSCLSVFLLGIISRFSWGAFETPLFYLENGNLAEETFLGLPESPRGPAIPRAPPWPPCKGQAYHAQGLCSWQHRRRRPGLALSGERGSSFQCEYPRLSAQIE